MLLLRKHGDTPEMCDRIHHQHVFIAKLEISQRFGRCPQPRKPPEAMR
jgi:hypothetical protein